MNIINRMFPTSGDYNWLSIINEKLIKFKLNTGQYPSRMYLPSNPFSEEINEIMGIKVSFKAFYDVSGNVYDVVFEV